MTFRPLAAIGPSTASHFNARLVAVSEGAFCHGLHMPSSIASSDYDGSVSNASSSQNGGDKGVVTQSCRMMPEWIVPRLLRLCDVVL